MGDVIALVVLFVCAAAVFGWYLRGWYDRRMNPTLAVDVTTVERRGNVYFLPERFRRQEGDRLE